MNNTKNNDVNLNHHDLRHLLFQIKKPIVCVKCSEEYLKGQTDARTLQDYSKFDVGFTDYGLQIFCQRHKTNICHLKFNHEDVETDFRSLEKK